MIHRASGASRRDSDHAQNRHADRGRLLQARRDLAVRVAATACGHDGILKLHKNQEKYVISIQSASKKYQLFIDGQWVDSESGKTFKTPNPATGETLAEVAEADKADIDKAVAAARRAFEGKWSKMSARDRGRLLYKLSQLIEQNAAELAAFETADNGKPIKESLYVDLPQVVENFEYFAGWATKIEGETIPVPGKMFNYTLREPIGVCGQIIPWNFPLLDGGVETRACARCRQYSRSQTRGTNARRRDGARQS